MANLNKILTVVYVSVQVTIALFVSVFGAIHVRRSIQEAFKKSIEAPPGDIDDNIKPFKESGDHAADDKLKESPSTETTPDDADGQKEADHAPPSYAEATMEHAPPSYAEATQATKAHALQPDADATIAMDIEDETGAMDIEDKTVAMDIADETVAMDIEDETGAMDIEDKTVAMDIADETVAMDIEDETGAMDIEDKTVAMDIADETVAMDIEDEFSI
eukprot:882982_1